MLCFCFIVEAILLFDNSEGVLSVTCIAEAVIVFSFSACILLYFRNDMEANFERWLAFNQPSFEIVVAEARLILNEIVGHYNAYFGDPRPANCIVPMYNNLDEFTSNDVNFNVRRGVLITGQHTPRQQHEAQNIVDKTNRFCVRLAALDTFLGAAGNVHANAAANASIVRALERAKNRAIEIYHLVNNHRLVRPRAASAGSASATSAQSAPAPAAGAASGCPSIGSSSASTEDEPALISDYWTETFSTELYCDTTGASKHFSFHVLFFFILGALFVCFRMAVPLFTCDERLASKNWMYFLLIMKCASVSYLIYPFVEVLACTTVSLSLLSIEMQAALQYDKEPHRDAVSKSWSGLATLYYYIFAAVFLSAVLELVLLFVRKAPLPPHFMTFRFVVPLFISTFGFFSVAAFQGIIRATIAAKTALLGLGALCLASACFLLWLDLPTLIQTAIDAAKAHQFR
eukprot:c18906_g1_i4.p1 GENE.c18906_g1_i4~~c18906_g1_i4.p1  ORF type:complete len:460 (+),score=17.04 c18906_g1_i4:575-1954(+)